MPRRLNDALIAAIALEHGLPILHQDRDFEYVAELTGLPVER
jgi:predicted nucleic acid-binding protein